MAKPIRVMVVDDSALYRKTISDVLSESPTVEVVAAAPNGRIALMKIPDYAPDLITLDMEMPEMDGLATLRELKTQHPKIKTIVFSAHTEKGADLTFKALRLGAVDFVTKPTAAGSMENSLNNIREHLKPKVIAFSNLLEPPTRPLPVKEEVQIKTSAARQMGPRDVIAIGISTGGPSSLVTFFEQLPVKMKQAILIVQHMPPIFTKKLAEQLGRVGTVPVHEAIDSEPIVGGMAYIAPGDFHMTVVRENNETSIRINQNPPENYCRPAIDVLFRSVAEIYGQRAVGVVMTGMGKDGLKGSQAMKSAGAAIVAQDEQTSVVWGMPRFIVENDLADAVSSLDNMFASINNFIL